MLHISCSYFLKPTKNDISTILFPSEAGVLLSEAFFALIIDATMRQCGCDVSCCSAVIDPAAGTLQPSEERACFPVGVTTQRFLFLSQRRGDPVCHSAPCAVAGQCAGGAPVQLGATGLPVWRLHRALSHPNMDESLRDRLGGVNEGFNPFLSRAVIELTSHRRAASPPPPAPPPTTISSHYRQQTVQKPFH